MQPGPLRRYSRRVQPRATGTEALSHTWASAAPGHGIHLSAQYLATLHDNLHRAQVEQQLWADEALLAANVARADRNETRRQAQEEAVRHAERQRQEQQRIYDERLEERRARAAEWEEHQRQETERIRREQEAEERRRIEEQAAAEEARRRETEEAERQRRERLRACVVCMEESDVDLTAQSPCGHWYCRTCMRDGIEASYGSRSRFQCCQQDVPVSLVEDLLTEDFRTRYELMVLEQTTLNPTYCANIECGAFIPPANYHGPDSAQCLQCHTDTCRHCRTRAHAGRGCTADQATQQVRALAAVVGWKTCPSCQNMVERRDGCLHMRCRCGAEFCYRCGGYWRACRSNCQGRYF